jgi:hypothetical protein
VSRAEAWFLWIATGLVGGTGIVYAVMRYALTPVDPYAVVNHPWQPAVQHLHVVAAPLLVFALGLIWQRHVWKKMRAGRGSGFRSGLALALTAGPMVVSGYLIQTATGEEWRARWVLVHVIASGLWLLGLVLHRIPRPERVAAPDAAP